MEINHKKYIGQRVSFDWNGKRLSGLVQSTEPLPNSVRGDIPTCRLNVRGDSGKVLPVDLTENRCSFPDA